ncbi:MAG TPA: NUDIX domain-containing protein [Acetobacteraceae bacterium]|nr:NUDIX domain-containing protein [Acetobacteraceae bacterium]
MSDPTRDVQIRGRTVLSDNWFKLEEITFEQTRRDGARQTLKREVYYNGPGAAVLPIDQARATVLLVRQLRIPAFVNGDGAMLIELCAGLVEDGHDPADTVRKEAEQEMGVRLRNLRKVYSLYTSPGASAEKLHLFVADYGPDDVVGKGGGVRGEGEEIETLELPIARAWEMVTAGEIVDAKTVLLLQHMRLAEVGSG